MTDGPTAPGGGKSLINRVRDILLKPKEEWPVIDREPATIGGIYTSYVMILAAIGPIAGLIGQQLMMGIFAPPIGFSIATAVLGYAITLASVYLLAFIIDALAPSFGGTKDMTKAFKVAAYASTAVWVAAVLNVIPLLGWLAILLGLAYSAYLLYLGLGTLMRVPADKAVGYTVVVIVAYVVIYFVAAFIVGMLVLSFFGAAMMTAPVVRY